MEGAIESHIEYDRGANYDSNMNCVWTLKATEDKIVELIPDFFSLEENSM